MYDQVERGRCLPVRLCHLSESHGRRSEKQYRKIRILNSLNRQYPASSLVMDVNMEIAQTYMADEKFRMPFHTLPISSPNRAGFAKNLPEKRVVL